MKLNASILIATALLVSTITIPVLRDLFDLVAIPLIWTWLIAGWLVLNVVLVEGAKLILRRNK